MNIRVLGALEASIDRRPVRLGAVKPRAVLAILALHPGEIVSTERLIEGLWGQQPPRDRRQASAALRVAGAQGADGERRR
jgi:SARP family transcriptional regulator, regulator of embCAB operon